MNDKGIREEIHKAVSETSIMTCPRLLKKAYEKLEEYEELEKQCNEENSWGLSTLLRKWKEFINDIHELYECKKLEEQGKLLKLPCAVGDTVWYWDKEHDPIEKAPFEGYVSGYEIVSSKTVYIIITQKTKILTWLPHDEKFEIIDFGKTIFLTKPEAEKALKEMGRSEKLLLSNI